MQVTIATDKELVVDRFHVYDQSGVICSVIQQNEHCENSFPLKIHGFRNKETFQAQQAALSLAFKLKDIGAKHISASKPEKLVTYAELTVSESPNRDISRITGGTPRNKLDFSRKEASIHKKGLYLPICDGLTLDDYYCLDHSSFTCYKNSVVITRETLQSLLGLVHFQKQYSPKADLLRNRDELIVPDFEVFVIENRVNREVLVPAWVKAASDLKNLLLGLAVSKYEKEQIENLSNDYFSRIIENSDKISSIVDMDKSVRHLKHSKKYYAP